MEVRLHVGKVYDVTASPLLTTLRAIMRSSIHGSLRGVGVISQIIRRGRRGVSLICSARPTELTRGIKSGVLWIIIRMPELGVWISHFFLLLFRGLDGESLILDQQVILHSSAGRCLKGLRGKLSYIGAGYKQFEIMNFYDISL